MRRKYIQEWEDYVNNCSKPGQFGKFNAKFQAIEEFLESKNW